MSIALWPMQVSAVSFLLNLCNSIPHSGWKALYLVVFIKKNHVSWKFLPTPFFTLLISGHPVAFLTFPQLSQYLSVSLYKFFHF